MSNKAEIVFVRYNKVIEDSYESFEKANENNKGMVYDVEALEASVKANVRQWNNTPMLELDGMTPKQYFDGIGCFDDAMETFRLGALICNEKLPEPLVDKVVSYGYEAFEALLELVGNREMMESHDNCYIPVTASELLGKWKSEEASLRLLDMMLGLDESSEDIAEGIRDALVDIGAPALEELLSRLENRDVMGMADEYAVSALVGIGKANKSDRVYRCLKNVFFKIDDKVLGAEFLADYDDGRVIPVLRGYVEKNIANIDEDTFYGILSVIKRLGGDIKDLYKEKS